MEPIPFDRRERRLADGPHAFAWMRPALAYLFDAYSEAQARDALVRAEALRAMRVALTGALSPEQRAQIPAGTRGDNLILALLALRVKFPRADAEAKLALNLRMRSQGPTG